MILSLHASCGLDTLKPLALLSEPQHTLFSRLCPLVWPHINFEHDALASLQEDIIGGFELIPYTATEHKRMFFHAIALFQWFR